jgi:hypothetical protein
LSVIPLTPAVARPIGRASLWGKRIPIPLRVTRTTSSLSEACRTEINSSSSARLIAMIPSLFKGVL